MKGREFNLSANAAFALFISAQRDYSDAGVANTLEALNSLKDKLPGSEKKIISLHDALLFSMAYPANREVYNLCRQVMFNLVDRVKKVTLENPNAFYNSGITGSEICARFGLVLNEYLLNQNLSLIELSDINGAETDLVPRLTFTLDSVEQELMDGNTGYFEVWKETYVPSSPKDQLAYYVAACRNAESSIVKQESLFGGFDVYTRFKLDECLDGLSLGRLKSAEIKHFPNGLRKHISVEEVMGQGKPKQVRLVAADKAELVSLARGSMAGLLRETDTFTYARVSETELFDLGHGIQVALFYMVEEQKFALQSYVGYLLFRNGHPLAYGGCWIVGFQAAFGVNVLPPFRGGESFRVVAELLRLYRFRFKVSRFSVDPYQIGQGNDDGIKSGAFWFYYKMGFRPIQPNLLKLAGEEAEKLKAAKDYRSSVRVLTKLADADLVLTFEEKPFVSLPAIQAKLSEFIKEKFKGNRQVAIISALTELKKATGQKVTDKQFSARLAVLLLATDSVTRLNGAELTRLIASYNLKSESEAESHLKQQTCSKYWNLLSGLV